MTCLQEVCLLITCKGVRHSSTTDQCAQNVYVRHLQHEYMASIWCDNPLLSQAQVAKESFWFHLTDPTLCLSLNLCNTHLYEFILLVACFLYIFATPTWMNLSCWWLPITPGGASPLWLTTASIPDCGSPAPHRKGPQEHQNEGAVVTSSQFERILRIAELCLDPTLIALSSPGQITVLRLGISACFMSTNGVTRHPNTGVPTPRHQKGAFTGAARGKKVF